MAYGGAGIAHDTISERASRACETAYHLSDGREFHDDAHSVAVTNLLHCTTNSIAAFALHHLRPLLPDLTDEQWARIDATVTALDSRVSEELTGANGSASPATFVCRVPSNSPWHLMRWGRPLCGAAVCADPTEPRR